MPSTPIALTWPQRIAALVLLLVFCMGFCSLSLVNHHLFRTNAYDLGYFNNAIYDYAHLRANSFSLNNWFTATNTLGDHFEPFLILVAPLSYVFGEWTLLLVQIAAILLGGMGVFRYVATRTATPWLPHLAMVHFSSIWGIYSALSFDYHNNVVGAMLLPWLLHHLEGGRWKRALPWMLVILMTKENMALWLFFVCLGTLPTVWRNPSFRRTPLAFAGLSLVWFVLVMAVVIPAVSTPGQTYEHFTYTHFGKTAGEAAGYLLSHPWEGIQALFINHFPEETDLNGVKAEVWLMLLGSGLLLLLRRPGYLLMLLPILLQKFLSDKTSTWSINQHYSIEFVPILAVGIFGWLARWDGAGGKSRRWMQWGAGIVVAGGTLLMTLSSLNWRHEFFYKYWRAENHFLVKEHYETSVKVDAIRRGLKAIPPKVPVAASSNLVPHLAMRDVVRYLPYTEGVDYVIMSDDLALWPMRDQAVEKLRQQLRDPTHWEMVFSEETVHVWKRKPWQPASDQAEVAGGEIQEGAAAALDGVTVQAK